MKRSETLFKKKSNRRSFLKNGIVAAGVATVGAGLAASGVSTFGAQNSQFGAQNSGRLTPGDTAILRFLAAAELIESDLWTQYAELGGIGSDQPIEVNPNPNPPLNPYQVALSNLDTDGPQYIASNTLDEMSHANFLNAYLKSRGAEPVDFSEFATLQGSSSSIASGK